MRRSPLGARGVVEVFDPVEIFERDLWRCRFCLEPVDPSASQRSPDGPTIDHIIRVHDGGVHSRANAATAHRGCNALVGNWAARDRNRGGAPSEPGLVFAAGDQ